MHEYSLTMRIIEAAEACAREHGAKRVTAVHLVVGDSSGCASGSVAVYFDLYAKGSLCDGAELHIERVTPMLRCKTCGELFERKPFSFDCPAEDCGGDGAPTEIGRELYIRSVKLESR